MIRSDYENFIDVLRENNIDRLYHITSRDNWNSIRKHGLYSAALLKQRGVEGYHSYADKVTRKSDEAIGADSFVHLSFSPFPIFLEAGIKSGKIDPDYIVLEISPEVIKEADTEFSNMSLHHNDVICGSSIESFKSIHFACAKSTDRQGLNLKKRKYCQAEVLVKCNIPPEYILNRGEIDNLIFQARMNDSCRRRAIIFLVDQTVSMGDRFIMNGKVFPSTSSAVNKFINQFISRLAKSYYNDGNPVNQYDVAVLGSSDTGIVPPLWNIQKFGAIYRETINLSSPFLSSEDLYNINLGNAIVEDFNWVTVNYDGWKIHTVDALKAVKEYLKKWLEVNSNNNYPPVVVYITEGGHLQYDPQSFIKICNEIRNLQTLSGNTMLWQIEYTPYHSDSLCLPGDIDLQGLDPAGRFMYSQASELSDVYQDKINEIATSKDSLSNHRAMAVNIDINDLYDLIVGC